MQSNKSGRGLQRQMSTVEIIKNLDRPIGDTECDTESKDAEKPYKLRLTSKDVTSSQHFSLNALESKSSHVLQDKLDIKNKVLADKRKALIQVLKDRRPDEFYHLRS